MVDRTPIQPTQGSSHVRFNAGGQEGSPFFQQIPGNRDDLGARLALAEDDLRKPLPDRPMMVYRREPQILVWECP